MRVTKNPAHKHHFLLPWIIWLIAAAFYGYEFFLQISPSVMVSNLMQDFHVNAAMLGNLAAFYFYSYTIMQIPSGLLLDRLGPRKVLFFATIICAFGAFIFSQAGVLIFAQLGRLLIGIGSAFAVLGVFKIIANWFPIRRFALLTGLTLTVGTIGAVSAGAPLAALVEAIDWRNSMLLLAICGFVLAIIIWLVIRDCPETIKNSKNKCNHEPKQLPVFKSLGVVTLSKQNWIVAIYGGLIFASTSAFGGLWGVPFIEAVYHISRPVAGGAVSMIFIGWAVGGPLFGYYSDAIARRKPTLWIAAFGSLATMLTIIYVILPITLLYCVLFLFGFISSAFLPSFSIMRERNYPETSATSIGFMNMINMVGGATLQPLIGYFLDLQWRGQMEHGLRVYTADSFHNALVILPITLALAIFMIPLIEETRCIQKVNTQAVNENQSVASVN